MRIIDTKNESDRYIATKRGVVIRSEIEIIQGFHLIFEVPSKSDHFPPMTAPAEHTNNATEFRIEYVSECLGNALMKYMTSKKVRANPPIYIKNRPHKVSTTVLLETNKGRSALILFLVMTFGANFTCLRQRANNPLHPPQTPPITKKVFLQPTASVIKIDKLLSEIPK